MTPENMAFFFLNLTINESQILRKKCTQLKYWWRRRRETKFCTLLLFYFGRVFFLRYLFLSVFAFNYVFGIFSLLLNFQLSTNSKNIISIHKNIICLKLPSGFSGCLVHYCFSTLNQVVFGFNKHGFLANFMSFLCREADSCDWT